MDDFVYGAYKGDDGCGFIYEIDGCLYSVHGSIISLEHLNNHLDKKAEFVSSDLIAWEKVSYV